MQLMQIAESVHPNKPRMELACHKNMHIQENLQGTLHMSDQKIVLAILLSPGTKS